MKETEEGYCNSFPRYLLTLLFFHNSQLTKKCPKLSNSGSQQQHKLNLRHFILNRESGKKDKEKSKGQY